MVFLASLLHYAARSWKYDASVLEFFVQTADKVSVRKSELDKLIRASEGSLQAANAEHNLPNDETEHMNQVKSF